LDDAEPTGPAELVVYITGGVRHPDVYRLPIGTRVKDAVLAAGGLRPDAAADQINLAAPLTDAGHVHIPLRSDPAAPTNATTANQGLLNLNQASLSDLEELPGIGPAMAERIVARRTEEGPFRSVEDLRSVTGVGEKLYAQIAPLVTVGP
jgi:competence protein ComEA